MKLHQMLRSAAAQTRQLSLPVIFIGVCAATAIVTLEAQARALGPAQETRIDGWTPQQLRTIQTLSLQRLGEPPGIAGNRYADNNTAAALGKALFFSRSLGGDNNTSCASCHLPSRFFTDGQARSGGANRQLGRNTPTTVGTGYQTWFYWDGRRDSLWSQALIPFEAPNEMGGDRVSVLAAITADPKLNALYQNTFGFPPYLPESTNIREQGAGPLSAEPAQSHWHHLTAHEKNRVNRSFANVGKAIEAFIRTQRYQPNKLDRYIAALEDDAVENPGDLISQQERLGLSLFIDDGRTQCLRCHSGPRLTNDNFQNIGTGTFSGYNLDFGRILGVQSLMANEFNCLGRYSDAKPEECIAIRFMNHDPHQPLMGAFKTPSLRNVAATAPYFHDGRHATLRDVIAHYVSPPKTKNQRQHELRPISLSEREIDALVGFLKMLSEPAPGKDNRTASKVTKPRGGPTARVDAEKTTE